MRMYLKLNSEQKDEQNLKFELERPEENQDNYVGDEVPRADNFVYVDENQEDKLFPSLESSEALAVKQDHLIKFVKQKEDLEAGLFVQQIFEDPIGLQLTLKIKKDEETRITAKEESGSIL